ncbi:MAG: hypothetical protein V5A66_03080 [Candidatus Thermoplasmatota archaeon]
MNKKAFTVILSFLVLLNGMLILGTSEATFEGDAHITEENGAYFEPEIINYTEEVELGDEIIIEYSVTNTGDAVGTQDIVLIVEIDQVNMSEEKTTEDVTLDPGQEWNNTFTYDTSDIQQDYGQDIIEIEVEVNVTLKTEDASDSVNSTLTSPGMIPGFDLILLAIGVTFAVVIYHTKKR